MEKTITMPLSEYEKLKKQNETLKKAFDEKAITMFHSSYFSGPSGYPHNDYKIMGETDMIKSMSEQLLDLHKQLNEVWAKYYEVKNEIKKPWF